MAAAPRPPHVTARAGAGGRQAKGEEAGAVTWRRRRRARAVRAAAAEGTGRAEGRCRRLPPAAAAVSECGAATVLEGGGGTDGTGGGGCSVAVRGRIGGGGGGGLRGGGPGGGNRHRCEEQPPGVCVRVCEGRGRCEGRTRGVRGTVVGGGSRPAPAVFPPALRDAAEPVLGAVIPVSQRPGSGSGLPPLRLK